MSEDVIVIDVELARRELIEASRKYQAAPSNSGPVIPPSNEQKTKSKEDGEVVAC